MQICRGIKQDFIWKKIQKLWNICLCCNVNVDVPGLAYNKIWNTLVVIKWIFSPVSQSETTREDSWVWASQSRTAETFAEVGELLWVSQLGPLKAAWIVPYLSENCSNLGGTMARKTKAIKQPNRWKTQTTKGPKILTKHPTSKYNPPRPLPRNATSCKICTFKGSGSKTHELFICFARV